MASENENGIRSFTAGEALEPFRRVKLSSGTAVYADAGDRHIGVTVDGAASGAQVAVKLINHPGTRKIECAGGVTAGATVYAADDGKIDDTFVALGASLGIALGTGDGSGSIIEVMPLTKEGGSELLAVAIAQSDALGASSAAEATFSNGTVTLPAGSIQAGDVYRIHARGTLPATSTSDEFTGKLYFGTEVLLSTAHPDAVNGDQFIIDAIVTVRVAGASGKLVVTAWSLNDALAVSLELPLGSAELSEDLAVACEIKVTGTWSQAAANEARLQEFVVERLRR